MVFWQFLSGFLFTLFCAKALLRCPIDSGTMVTSYEELYPWAAMGLRREMSSFILDWIINQFRRGQRLCWSNEADMFVVRCELDKLVCVDTRTDPSGQFCFFYSTLFSKVGLRLPLNSFEKRVVHLAECRPHPIASE